MLFRILKTPHVLLPPVIVFTMHLIGTLVFDLYTVWPNFDVPMHFFGGFSIGISTWYIYRGLRDAGIMKQLPRWLFLFLASAAVTWVAFVWECGEFVSDVFFATNMQAGLADTMLDMFLGMLGGAIAAAIWFRS